MAISASAPGARCPFLGKPRIRAGPIRVEIMYSSRDHSVSMAGMFIRFFADRRISSNTASRAFLLISHAAISG